MSTPYAGDRSSGHKVKHTFIQKKFISKANWKLCGEQINWYSPFSSIIKSRLHYCRFSQVKETFHRRIFNNIFTPLSSLLCKKVIIIFISHIFHTRKSMILMKRAKMMLMRVEWILTCILPISNVADTAQTEYYTNSHCVCVCVHRRGVTSRQ